MMLKILLLSLALSLPVNYDLIGQGKITCPDETLNVYAYNLQGTDPADPEKLQVKDPLGEVIFEVQYKPDSEEMTGVYVYGKSMTPVEVTERYPNGMCQISDEHRKKL